MLWNSSDQADSLWSPSAKFWPFPALWLVEKFPYSSRQTAQEIDLKLDGFIHYHYATPLAWLTFGLDLINFWSHWILTFFLASDCDRSSSSSAFTDKPLVRFSWNSVGKLSVPPLNPCMILDIFKDCHLVYLSLKIYNPISFCHSHIFQWYWKTLTSCNSGLQDFKIP